MLCTRTTLLSLLSLLAVTTSASVPVGGKIGVSGWTFGRENCSQDSKDLLEPDGVCVHLPGKRMQISYIGEGCRVFVYEKENCSGYEKQVYARDRGDEWWSGCTDISGYYAIKVWCG
ncbi:hypothetical protein BCR34DRAFT_581362 [Clohesyomyces aquaticus]|uniref:Beta/gamma crystallin 'Greek key' domain-containing protein n=1 Tax=Clohesyomyces aquaticus TaxID=1231657 RepID=A0A1Y1Y168_9PLEO|nr:hypothetical protein BCR34DRAFT_581362 [Clohesyomyces aquaticus]